jgi:hypothetical protein
MSDIGNSRGPAPPGRRSDLWFAGMVSAGMIATVLVVAALLTPILAWHGSQATNAPERSQTIRLSEPSARAVAPAPISSFANDRPGHVAAASGSRLALSLPLGSPAARRTAGRAPRVPERIGVSERTSQTGRVPLATSNDDSDGDGLPDVWELRYGLNPNNATDGAQDTDGDGLDNRTELRTRTAPNGADSDGNGVRDGDEDSDADGLRNVVELRASSDPSRADSNGDGVNDTQDDSDGDGALNLAEQQAGSDPGSSDEVPPVAGTDEPTPGVVEDDPGDVTDDNAPDPPAPEHPADDPPPAPAPAPATVPQPAPAAPVPAPTPAVTAPTAAPPAPEPSAWASDDDDRGGRHDRGGHGSRFDD